MTTGTAITATGPMRASHAGQRPQRHRRDTSAISRRRKQPTAEVLRRQIAETTSVFGGQRVLSARQAASANVEERQNMSVASANVRINPSRNAIRFSLVERGVESVYIPVSPFRTSRWE